MKIQAFDFSKIAEINTLSRRIKFMTNSKFFKPKSFMNYGRSRFYLFNILFYNAADFSHQN